VCRLPFSVSTSFLGLSLRHHESSSFLGLSVSSSFLGLLLRRRDPNPKPRFVKVFAICVCAPRREEPEKPTEAVAMSMDSANDELSLDVVVEERQLEAHNEAYDAQCLLLGTIDLDGAGAQTGTGTTRTDTHTGSIIPTTDASTSVLMPGKRSRRRAPTSKVWLPFEEVTAMQNGKEVRVSAICLHWKNSKSAKSSSRTGHLIRHLDLCPAKKEKDRSRKTQSLLKYNVDGSVNH
jgi:hypothetical protein